MSLARLPVPPYPRHLMPNKYIIYFSTSIVFLLKNADYIKKRTIKDSQLSNLEETARNYYQNGEYAQALSVWLELLHNFPKRDDYLLSCGNCFDALGNKNAAAKYYLKAHKANKKSLPALTNLATACYETDNLQAAEKYSRQALRLDAENLPALINLGNVLYRQKNYAAALQYYQRAAALQPDYYVAEINLANTYFDLQDYTSAAKHAKAAAVLDSQSAQAWTLLGNAAQENGRVDEALEAFAKAAEIDSSDPWIYNYLSQVYQKKSLWKEALENGWQAVEKSGGEDAHHINFGYLLYETSLEKADSLSRDYAWKWLEKYPENPIAKHMGQALSDGHSELTAPPEYVRNIFDVFAADFERVLHDLEYCAPDLIQDFLKEIYGEKKHPKMKILDAGCGTGLCGVFLKKYASFRGLDGVDLSAGMLREAAAKKVYNKLICQDIVLFLNGVSAGYELVVSADVFTYIGNLKNLFLALRGALKKNGRVIFSISENSLNDSDWFLHISGRFLHRREYIENLLLQTGFSLEKIRRAKLRNEGDSEVWGYVVAAQKRGF